MKKLLTLLALSTSFVAGTAFSADEDASSSSNPGSASSETRMLVDQYEAANPIPPLSSKNKVKAKYFEGLEAHIKQGKKALQAEKEKARLERMAEIRAGLAEEAAELLKMGITHDDLADISDQVFVEAAEQQRAAKRAAKRAAAEGSVAGSVVELMMEPVQVGTDRGGQPIFEMRRVAKAAEASAPASKAASKQVEAEAEAPAPKAKAAAAAAPASKAASKQVEAEAEAEAEAPAPKAKAAAAAAGSKVESVMERVQVGTDRGGQPIFEMRRVAKAPEASAPASKAASKQVEDEGVPAPESKDASSHQSEEGSSESEKEADYDITQKIDVSNADSVTLNTLLGVLQSIEDKEKTVKLLYNGKEVVATVEKLTGLVTKAVKAAGDLEGSAE